jgi:hypothetical protein
VFALQNALAGGNVISKWLPRVRLGLNLGPSPLYARNVYLVLNLSTRLVSPQYHCCFDDFFETTKYGRPDIAISSTWQQLAGLICATAMPSQNQASTLHDPKYHKTPSDTNVPSENITDSQEEHKITWDLHKNTTGYMELTTSQYESYEI